MAIAKGGDQFEFGEVVATPVGILSYPKVWEAVQNDLSGKTQFSCSVLISKQDANMAALVAEGLRVGKALFGEQLKSLTALGDRGCPIKDGDLKDAGDPANGCWIIPASSNQDRKPFVVDANKLPIGNHAEIYGGAIGLMFVQPMAYHMKVGKGVKFMLKGIQKIADGKPFGQAQYDPAAAGFQTPAIPDYLRGHVQDKRSYAPSAPSAPAPSNGRTAADNALIKELKSGFGAVEVTGDSDAIPF
jgi:hypothetical protein